MPETLDSLIGASVPGEVLVSLGVSAAGDVNAPIPLALERGSGPDREQPRRFGLPQLDDLLARWRATSIQRVTLPAVARLSPGPNAEASEPFVVEALDAITWYRIRFEPGAVDSEDAARQMATLEDVVASASPNYYRATHAVPNDPEFLRQWGLERIRAPAAWDIERGRAAVVVAVLDTGIDMAHEELRNRFAAGTSADVVNLRRPPASPHPDWFWQGDVHDIDADPIDEVGHGTHIAGIIAASPNNGFLGAGVAGCSLMNVRVLGRLVHRDGSAIGFGTAFDITAGIEWAIARRASIINMSFGFPNGTRPEKEAIERAFAANILPVAAMGNEMPRNPILAPAEYRHTVAVGAIDAAGQRWPRSQTGPHISLVAPGVAIESTMPAGRFGSLSGTSMATAFVSGAAALVRSRRPDLTAGAVRMILERSADPLGMSTRPTPELGFGCVDAFAALRLATTT